MDNMPNSFANNNYSFGDYYPPEMSYYNQAVNQNVPITLTWFVNAYAEKQKGLIQKIKERINPPEEDDTKHILKNVSGLAKPGELMAIMGASGSGKTTLLNVLNFCIRGNIYKDGDVKINGEIADWEMISRVSGYMRQDDLFRGTLTVKEHLTFQAMLKMGYDFTYDEILNRVDEVIYELNLIKVENNYIGMGDKAKGISGGEKRRLAFGSEILTNPSLLFCDEPTSGLDSFMALSVVESMSNLAKTGKTVISTIHQPSSQIFEKFDSLCILAEGRVAYLGSASEAENYFSSVGFSVPYLYNPADFYIQTLAIDENAREFSLQKIENICNYYEQGQQQARINSEIAQAEGYPTGYFSQESDMEYNSSFLSQLYWLFWRQFRCEFRDPLATKVLAAQTIVIATFIGLIFLQLPNSQTDVQNRSGVLFITLMQCNFGYVFAVVNTFPIELPLVYRESKNKTYGSLPYFLVKVLADMPKLIILPFLLCTIIYWMTGLYNDALVYIEIILIFLLVVQCAVAFGTFISVVAPNLNVALALVIPIIMPILIFAGYFLNNSTTPVYFIWIKYISWFFYGNDAINIILWTQYGSIPCTENSTSFCYNTGNDVLKQFSFDSSTLGRDIGVMFAIIAFFRFFSYFIFRFKLKRL